MIRLLIVDDAPFVREIVRNMVHREKEIEIVGEAENGIEAVQLAMSLKPDVVLMDLVLPEKNGIEATREILDFDEQIRIVAFSTNDTEDIVCKALAAGAVSFLPKPFQTSGLIAAIKEAGSLNKEESIKATGTGGG